MRTESQNGGHELPERLLRRNEVEALTGLSRSAIYAKMAAGEFPRPFRLGKQSVAWKVSQIYRWIASLEASTPR